MSLVEAITRIRPSVVQICFSATGLSRELQQQARAPFILRILGTGFFVNSDANVITARHVIQKGQNLIERIDATQTSLLVGLGLPNSENFLANRVLVDFDLADEDANYDLALLRLRRNPFRGEVSSGIRIGEEEMLIDVEAPQLNPSRPEEGQRIAISGYPLEERVLVTNSGYIASVWTRPNYLADVEVNPGNSGGPVYLIQDASVIGVCIASGGAPVWRESGEVARILDQELYYSSGLTHVIPISYAVEVLNRNQLEYSIVSTDNSQ